MAHLRRLRGEDKAAYFRGLQRDGVANAWHYNAMISATVDPDRARTLLAEMRSAGVKPDVVTFTSLITLEMRRGRWQVAEAYMRELGTEGLADRHDIAARHHSAAMSDRTRLVTSRS